MNGDGNVPKAIIKDKAFDELYQTLSRLTSDIDGVAKQAIYEGAGVIADAVRKEINTIRTSGPSEWETKRRERQKQSLLGALSTAPIQPFKNGIYGGVGFGGYDDETGKPIQLIARAFNSGTSFSSKQPFFENAVRKSKGKARSEAIRVLDEKLKELTKG